MVNLPARGIDDGAAKSMIRVSIDVSRPQSSRTFLKRDRGKTVMNHERQLHSSCSLQRSLISFGLITPFVCTRIREPNFHPYDCIPIGFNALYTALQTHE